MSGPESGKFPKSGQSGNWTIFILDAGTLEHFEKQKKKILKNSKKKNQFKLLFFSLKFLNFPVHPNL